MKVAVSIPDPVFAEAERLGKALRVSRSRLYADALIAYSRGRSAEQVRAQLDAVYSVQRSQVPDVLALAQVRSLCREAW